MSSDDGMETEEETKEQDKETKTLNKPTVWKSDRGIQTFSISSVEEEGKLGFRGK